MTIKSTAIVFHSNKLNPLKKAMKVCVAFKWGLWEIEVETESPEFECQINANSNNEK